MGRETSNRIVIVKSKESNMAQSFPKPGQVQTSPFPAVAQASAQPALSHGNPLADIDGVQMNGSRFPFFTDGDYILEINKTVTTKTRPSFVVEFTIVSSNNAERPAGMRCTWVQSLKNPPVAKAAIKQFLASACGYSSDAEVTASGVSMAQVSNECYANPVYLAGQRVAALVKTIRLTSGTDFTRHDFSPVDAA